MPDDIKHLECFVQDKDIPEKELVELIKRYKETECPEIHEKIVMGRMNFILNQSKKFNIRYNSLEYCEVLSGIFDGVTRAIKIFDPTKGTRFSTYSIFWIRVYLTSVMVSKGSSVSLSNVMYSKVKQLSGMITVNENISDTELLDRLKVSKRKLRELKAIRECMNNYSIHSDQYIESQMEQKLQENIKDITYDKDFLESCLDELDDRNSFIIREKFGLNGADPKTYEDIASKMPITHQRTHQICQSSLKKLRAIYNRRTEENERKSTI